MALALLDEQLDEVCSAYGWPRTDENLAAIERQIDNAAYQASRGHLAVIEQLPSPLARSAARARAELLPSAPGVTIRSGTGGH